VLHAVDQAFDFLNRRSRAETVNHRVAVRADRPEVFDRIEQIRLTDFAERLQVVDVNKARAPATVMTLETEAADDTVVFSMFEATRTGIGISFIAIYGGAGLRPFPDGFIDEFIWKLIDGSPVLH